MPPFYFDSSSTLSLSVRARDARVSGSCFEEEYLSQTSDCMVCLMRLFSSSVTRVASTGLVKLKLSVLTKGEADTWAKNHAARC